MPEAAVRTRRGRIAAVLVRVGFVAAVAATVVYLSFVRPLQMRWGASDTELAIPLPGDRVIGNATFVATRAVTIDAPPSRVWSAIVRMGQREERFAKGFEANRYMLWLGRKPPRATWCWSLAPIGEQRTRLVTRVRFHHAWLSPAFFRVLAADLANGFSVRQAMLAIKNQAEAPTTTPAS
jgi:hypothetical protein